MHEPGIKNDQNLQTEIIQSDSVWRFFEGSDCSTESGGRFAEDITGQGSFKRRNRRGTIYVIYDFCRFAGVSPWYY